MKQLLVFVCSLILLISNSQLLYGFTETAEVRYITTTNTNVNMRMGPSRSSKRIQIIPKDTIGILIEQKSNWCQIACKNKVGWVYKPLLKISKVLTNGSKETWDTQRIRQVVSQLSTYANTNRQIAFVWFSKGNIVEISYANGDSFHQSSGTNHLYLNVKRPNEQPSELLKLLIIPITVAICKACLYRWSRRR